MRALGISTILLALPFALLAQGTTPTAFVTTVGKDTFCLEQYTRTKNVISGTWTVLHPPGVYVHDYRITLGDDGVPVRYTMKYSTPGRRRRRTSIRSPSTTVGIRRRRGSSITARWTRGGLRCSLPLVFLRRTLRSSPRTCEFTSALTATSLG